METSTRSIRVLVFVEEPLQWSQNLVVGGYDSVHVWCGVCGSGELLLSLNAGYALG